MASIHPPQMKEEQMLDLSVSNTSRSTLDPNTFLQWSGNLQDSSTHFGTLNQIQPTDNNNSSWLFCDTSFPTSNVENLNRDCLGLFPGDYTTQLELGKCEYKNEESGCELGSVFDMKHIYNSYARGAEQSPGNSPMAHGSSSRQSRSRRGPRLDGSSSMSVRKESGGKLSDGKRRQRRSTAGRAVSPNWSSRRSSISGSNKSFSSSLSKFTHPDENGKRKIRHDIMSIAESLPALPGLYFDKKQKGFRVRYQNVYVGWVALSRFPSIEEAYCSARAIWENARAHADKFQTPQAAVMASLPLQKEAQASGKNRGGRPRTVTQLPANPAEWLNSTFCAQPPQSSVQQSWSATEADLLTAASHGLDFHPLHLGNLTEADPLLEAHWTPPTGYAHSSTLLTPASTKASEASLSLASPPYSTFTDHFDSAMGSSGPEDKNGYALTLEGLTQPENDMRLGGGCVFLPSNENCMDQYDFGLRSNGAASDIEHSLCGLNLMTTNNHMDSFGGGGMPGAISYSKPVVDCPPPQGFKAESEDEEGGQGKFNSNESGNSDVDDEEQRSLLMGLNRSGVKRETLSPSETSLALSGIVWDQTDSNLMAQAMQQDEAQRLHAQGL